MPSLPSLPIGFGGRETIGVGGSEQVRSEDRLAFGTDVDYSLLASPGGLVVGQADFPNIASAVNHAWLDAADFARSASCQSL
jgi:hypothetical protein